MGILKDKSLVFSLSIIGLYKELTEQKKEFIISKQLLRSGTAVGALIYEGEFAQSSKDFINKYSISAKEANESLYWLVLLKDAGYISVEKYTELSGMCKELINMLVSSIKTIRKRIEK